MEVPVIETERLRLRALGPEDVAPITAFYASDRSRFVGGLMTAEESWRALAVEIGHWTLRGYGRFAVVEKTSGRLAGVIGPWSPEGWPEPEIGWDLMEGFEGQGYATEAGRAALDHVYDTLGWPTAISLVADGNDASAAVALRLGARPDGTYLHPRFGPTQIFRHIAPGERT